jgi:hypothetical protein
MSSVQSVVASTTRNQFFVSLVSGAECYTAAGANASPSTAGAAGVVVRDMGKTIRTPGISAVGSVTSQLILRKVARTQVNATMLASGGLAPTTGFVGFIEGAQDPSNSWYTFYINLYGGKWASVAV